MLENVARTTLAALLEEARALIAPRLTPEEARAATIDGAFLVDTRSADDRRRDGAPPGSVHIPRSVLEWRLDPDSGYMNPHVGGFDRRIVVLCAHGESSSLAAATLRRLGYPSATDVVGGFEAWRQAGLPIGPATEDAPHSLPGMGRPSRL
jgi:rhodanese-related sulfurtransferase